MSTFRFSHSPRQPADEWWLASIVGPLRWIMIHVIEEYARHNSHADFVRERIDGQTGE